MPIKITSPAFVPNAPIPKQFTGEGADISPPLAWSGVAKAAKRVLLICEDPDAPKPEPFVHWVLYNLMPETGKLPEGLRKDMALESPTGALQGRNSFDKLGYNGPLPPKGHGIHHYHFRLYALDQKIDLPGGLDKAKLLAAVKKHIIEEGELIGTYVRN